MDEELKTYLDGKFAAMDVRFTAIDDRFAAIDVRFAAIDDRFAEIRAEIESVETRLLSEFWKWGRNSDQRMRRVEHSDATTAERLASMEDRIFTLERKVAGGKQ